VSGGQEGPADKNDVGETSEMSTEVWGVNARKGRKKIRKKPGRFGR